MAAALGRVQVESTDPSRAVKSGGDADRRDPGLGRSVRFRLSHRGRTAYSSDIPTVPD